jgi:formylglycine-generating enzyme required for sulfatase activity
MTFNLIPAGAFTMGSPEDEPGRYNDEAQHQVTLTQAFYMQTTEVTQDQWQAVMGSNPSTFSSCGSNCPVESVSWDDIQGFISALNARGEGTYRLPTEAEWEYACRAGSTTAFANGGISVTDCSYDADLNAMGWYCYNSDVTYSGCADCSSWGGPVCAGTHPGAQKQANAWGLYDMHGNVWEWCSDWYGSYPSGSVTDPTGPSTGTFRVLRGGCWVDGAQFCRSAGRNLYPSFRISGGGFRLVALSGQ